MSVKVWENHIFKEANKLKPHAQVDVSYPSFFYEMYEAMDCIYTFIDIFGLHWKVMEAWKMMSVLDFFCL